MDRRYEAYKRLHNDTTPEAEPIPRSSVMIEGKQSEFWRDVKAEIDRQIHREELRFLDRLAPSYEVYLQAWSRRQALIAVLAIPETAKEEKS